MRASHRLDLDHIGTHVGQILGGSRSLKEVAETDNPDSVEQQTRSSLSCRASVGLRKRFLKLP
jgi:hypothetical protein